MNRFQKALACAGVVLVGALGISVPAQVAVATATTATEATKVIEAAPSATPTAKLPSTIGKPMVGQKLNSKVTKGAPVNPGKVSTQSLTSCTSNCYKYNTGLQNVTSTLGVTANVMISWPFSDTCTHDPGAHSIAELASIKSRAGGGRDIVEIGWRSDYCTYGNDEPHLFVFYWVNGSPAPGGYNSGYTPYTGAGVSPYQPGDALGSLTGSAKQMGVQYVTTGGIVGWAFSFDNKWMGVIPADPAGSSLATNKWYGSGANYTSSTQIQAFGEVWSTYNEPCTDMENGRWGTISPHSSPYDYYSDAAYFSNVTPLGNTPSLTLSKTPSTEVNYELQFLSGSVKSFFLGGGGYTSTGGNGGPGGSC
jgi:hypothetical protein